MGLATRRTARYTLLMWPLYILARISKTSSDHPSRDSAAGQCSAIAITELRGGR
jgi:hypothetical protein